MYGELLKTYNELTPKADDSEEIKAVKFLARRSISRCMHKIEEESDSKWHTDRPTPNEYYFVSGRKEGDLGIGYYNKIGKWETIYDINGEEVEFCVMGWRELPLWFDWEQYPEEFGEE